MPGENVPNSDATCSTCKNIYRKCSCLSLRKVPASTDDGLTWAKMNGLQRFLTIVGYIFTAIIALGCGISIAAAFITLSLITSGAASYFIAALLFVAGTAVNWLIYKNAVPGVLVEMFGKEKIGQGLFEVAGGCDLLRVDAEPTKRSKLNINSRSAYIRYTSKDGKKDSLYYYDKDTHKLEPLDKIKPDALKRFDLAMGIDDKFEVNKPKKLSYKDLLKITDITGHSRLSTNKKGAMVVGFFLALAAGIMQGVLTYGSTFTLSNAFMFLAAISSAFPPIAAVLAVVTVISLTAVLLRNIATWVKTPNALQDFKKYCKNLFDFTTPQCELLVRNEAPEPGRLNELQLSHGSAFIRVQYKLYFVDKEKNKCTEITPDIFKLAQLDNALGIKDDKPVRRDLGFAELDTITTLTGNKIKTKSRARVISERVLTAFLTILALPLAALGVYMTMNACAGATKVFLLKSIPNAAVMVVDIVSKVLGLGLAFLGRIPFTFRNTVRTIGHGIDPKLEVSGGGAKKKKSESSQSLLGYVWERCKVAVLYTFCFINAIGNGLISMVGGGRSAGPAWGGVIGVAGTSNSLTAGVASGLLGGSNTSSSGSPERRLPKKTVDDFLIPSQAKNVQTPSATRMGHQHSLSTLPPMHRTKSSLTFFSDPGFFKNMNTPTLPKAFSTIDIKGLSY